MEILRAENLCKIYGTGETEVRAILATQALREQRLAAADDVLPNDGDLAALKAQIADLHQQYLRMAAQKAKAKC